MYLERDDEPLRRLIHDRSSTVPGLDHLDVLDPNHRYRVDAGQRSDASPAERSSGSSAVTEMTNHPSAVGAVVVVVSATEVVVVERGGERGAVVDGVAAWTLHAVSNTAAAARNERMGRDPQSGSVLRNAIHRFSGTNPSRS
jgi:hypothetical protein